MKYQLFQHYDADSKARAGIQVENARPHDLGGCTVDALLENWDASRRWLQSIAEQIAGGQATEQLHPLDPEKLSYAPPVIRPGTIYAAGANYRDHVEAMARATRMKLTTDPKSDGIPPWHFIKASSSIVGSGQSVPFPAHVRALDWEAELAVVIGRTARNVPVESALGLIAGYTCANDLSARDQLVRTKIDASSPFRFDWIGSKSFTGSCPLGPTLTPAQFVDSPEDLAIRLWVNDVLRQDSSTKNHIFTVAEQIAYLSERVTLQPGDILLTGTPAGVGMETGTFLAKGDRLKVQIAGLGSLETRLV